jgi:sugar lactone lactonase YvrE
MSNIRHRIERRRADPSLNSRLAYPVCKMRKRPASHASWFSLLLLSVSAGFLAQPLLAQVADEGQVRGAPSDSDEIRARIASLEKQLPHLPDRAAGLYFLAVERQRIGDTLEALKLLKECVNLHEGFDPSGSQDLKILKGQKEFDDLVTTVHKDFPVVAQAKLAFVTTEKDLIPEGLAYDAKKNVLYLSSLYRRKIVKIDAEGKDFDFVPPGRDRLLPVLGIRPDPADGTVWAASWDEKIDRSELVHFDAAGNLIARYAPFDGARHGFNDLVLLKNGDVLLTDSVSNQLLRFAPAAQTFSPIATHRALSEPNGIAIDDDFRAVYVADDFGVIRVDLPTGASTDVNPGPRNTLAGIDGLYWNRGSLIAVQNAIGSPRIAAFRLTADGTRVSQITVLENRSSFTTMPSTGALHGNDFYFIANTQVDNLNGDHILDVTTLQPVRIAVVHLP